MSQQESKRLSVIDSVLSKQRTQMEASFLLGLSVRQIKRLCAQVREKGAVGLISRRRGSVNCRKIVREEQTYFTGLVREHYADFGPQLAWEYLSEHHGYTRSVETLRQWMIQGEIWKRKRRRSPQQHATRARRSRRGELIQIDGSLHDWFEGREGAVACSLLAFIDDATSEVLYAQFFPRESTQAYLSCLQSYIERHGLPLAFYSDKHSIFTKHDMEDLVPTQFGRTLSDLGIEGICAHTPQAKGRVERLFETLQDRLVKAMRIEKINDIESANRWLNHQYIQKHNNRFANRASDPEDAHQPCQLTVRQLSLVCSVQEKRVLRNLTCSFKGEKYVVQTGGAPRYALNQKRIIVCTTTEDEVVLLNGTEELPYQVFGSTEYKEKYFDAKTINAHIDEIVKQRPPKHIPGNDHPWRHMPI